MNNIQVQHTLEDRINPYSFTLSLWQAAHDLQLVSEEEYASLLLQAQLLLKQNVLQENSYKSTCIAKEKADSLRGSLFYILDYGLRKENVYDILEQYKTIPLCNIYSFQERRIFKEAEELRPIYAEMVRTRIKSKQDIYNDLYDGRLYRVISWFNPHTVQDMGTDVNYQVLNYDMRGDDLLKVKEYMNCVIEENQYLNTLPKDEIEWCVDTYCRRYRDAIEESYVNIMEICLVNQVGNMLLGKEGLRLNEEDILQLEQILMTLDIPSACEKLFKNFSFNHQAYTYRKQMEGRLVHAVHHHSLDSLFLVEYTEQHVQVKEAEGMSQEEFMRLFDRIDCCSPKERVSLIAQSYHTYGDFVDIMEAVTLEEEEYEELFNRMSDMELAFICNNILTEVSASRYFKDVDIEDMSQEWQRQLWDYIHNRDKEEEIQNFINQM